MVTTVGTESAVAELLKNLLRLDHDAIEAYKEAVKRLDDPGFRSVMESFMLDHQRHTQELSTLLREIGETPPTGGDMKQMLTRGKVVLADMAGDKAILQAMRTNEDDTNTAYERAVKHPDATPRMKSILDAGLADERRHCTWIVDTIARL